MIKKLLITLFLITSLVSVSQITEAVPIEQGKVIRAGISDKNFSNYYFKETAVSATDNFRLSDKATNTVIADFGAGEIVKIIIENNLFVIKLDTTEIAKGLKGPIVVESDNGFVSSAKLMRAGKPAYYRGVFEITKVPNKDNQFNLINVVDVESYLRGVVPNEMPVRFGVEALKAQAVLARNYVLKPREKNYHNFDVCDSVACQVYYGANTEKELSDKAIRETQNIVAMYNDELILALYSSTAGGYTESYENAFSTDMANGVRIFPGAAKPFLKGVPDNKDTPVLNSESAARKFYTSTPETFDNASPYFRWTKEWEQKELQDVLKKTLKAQSSSGFVKPILENPDDFGVLKDIKVIKRGVSGKAMSVNIITDKNIFNVQKELQIRRVFQKNNISLPSANVIFDFETIKPDKSDKKALPVTKIVARGGGFGHGVGMSQWGAGSMNEMGYSYGDIIQHYYKNTSIATYPVTLSSANGEDTAIQLFYTTDKKASLVVENKFQFTKMTIVLNGQELRLELAPRLFKSEKFDLSPYLVKGENRITYVLPYSDTNKKPVKLYVELKEAINE